MAILLVLLSGSAAVTQSLNAFHPSTANEEQVRAAFLFQLAQYVQWPASALPPEGAPLHFCVLGHDNLLVTLEQTVRGKVIDGRPIQVQDIADPSQLKKCHLAFLGFHSEKQTRAALARWTYPPVLLVGESDNFAEVGGMVNLVIQKGRVSFEINLGASERAQLSFRSQLLRFARFVGDKAGGQS